MLFRSKKDAVDAEVKKQFPKLSNHKTKYKVNGSTEAYIQGMKDGANMTLHRGSVEGNSNKQIA